LGERSEDTDAKDDVEWERYAERHAEINPRISLGQGKPHRRWYRDIGGTGGQYAKRRC